MNKNRRQPSMFGNLARRIQSPGFMGGGALYGPGYPTK